MEKQFINCVYLFNGWLWDHFLLVLLIGVCLYFTLRLKAMPLFRAGNCLQLAHRRRDRQPQGEIGPFESMMASLSLNLGVGSIIGVSTAIILGGFGAVFWMLLISVLGFAIRYAEALLSIKYRTVNEKGEVCGGPMYYMANGLKKRWLGICFAVFGTLAAFTGGAAVQAHSIALTAKDAMQLSPFATGSILFLLTALVIFGGIKRIAKLSSSLGTMLVILYTAGGLVILVSHLDMLPHALYVFFSSAFSPHAASGGMLGASLSAVIQLGLTWGVTSNLVGWGSSSIAAAAAKTDVPGRQALIVMGGSFLCILLSLITALVLFVTDAPALIQSGRGIFSAASFVMYAFRSVIPAGDVLVLIVLLFFGFAAIAGWGYCGEKCFEFVCGRKGIMGYRVLLCAFAFIGSVISLEVLWPFSSCINGLMALTNVIALIALSSVVAIETRVFSDLLAKERRQEKSAELS